MKKYSKLNILHFCALHYQEFTRLINMENENKELDQNKSRKKKEPKTGWKAELISWIQVLVSAAVIAFVLTTFVIANSEVPTGSMENTIMAHSRVIGSQAPL